MSTDPTPQDDGCPPGYKYIDISGPPCFWMSDVIGYHHEAMTSCASMGGVLAMLKDQDTLEKVIYYAVDLNKIKLVK